MLQGVSALKLKGKLYCLSTIHSQSNKHTFWLRTQSVPPQKLDGRLSRTSFVSRTVFNLKEYISVNTNINPILLTYALTMFMSITTLQKLVTARI